MVYTLYICGVIVFYLRLIYTMMNELELPVKNYFYYIELRRGLTFGSFECKRLSSRQVIQQSNYFLCLYILVDT